MLKLWRFKLGIRLDRTREAIGRLVRRKIACDNCGYFFDPADKRGFLRPTHHDYRFLRPRCPACHQMRRGCEAWAVHNDCQGIFSDYVYASRAEALAKLDGGALERVVPVRIIAEAEDDHWKRRWDEDKLEKAR